MIHTGPIFDRVDSVLDASDDYRRFRAGALTRPAFAAFLDAQRDALIAGGVPDEDVDYAKRYPVSHDRFVNDALTLLRDRGVIANVGYTPELLTQSRARRDRFDHGGRTTYIYPEEGDLLAALTAIARPRNVIFLGAYYGFWASAIVPVLSATGGVATLVDPDPACCLLARRNFAEEISTDLVRVVETTGEALLAEAGAPYDLVVIDAELPRDHPEIAMRGKGVYAALLEAALPRLAPHAMLVCHNILLEDRTGAPVFTDILTRNRRELAAFGTRVCEAMPNWTEIHSTEGMGVASLGQVAP